MRSVLLGVLSTLITLSFIASVMDGDKVLIFVFSVLITAFSFVVGITVGDD